MVIDSLTGVYTEEHNRFVVSCQDDCLEVRRPFRRFI